MLNPESEISRLDVSPITNYVVPLQGVDVDLVPPASQSPVLQLHQSQFPPVTLQSSVETQLTKHQYIYFYLLMLLSFSVKLFRFK